MKPSKMSTLTTSTVFLLAAGLLSGCSNEPEDAANQSKEIVVDPVQNVQVIDEPVLNIDEYGRISSIDDAVNSGLDTASDMLDSISDTADGAIDASEDAASDIAIVLMDEADEAFSNTQDLISDIRGGALEEIEELTLIVEDAAVVESFDDDAEVVGATSEIIRGVQQALVDAGLNPGPVDGYSGRRTTAALKSYQQQNDLIANGQLTKQSLRALGVSF
ncbi:MAG: peptidoglycan-binding protein [Nitrosomonas sp.]|nr:peptidoglycan-binding protein [Nitrosomonas sp.]